MPLGTIGAYACRDIQVRLVDYFGRNAAQFRTLGSVALIKWLLSPQNTANFQRINVTSIPGKKRGVAFMTESPFCFNLCALNRVCTTPPQFFQPEDGELVFDMTNPPWRHCDDQGRPVALKFDLEDLMKYCQNDDYTWIQNKIARYLLRWEEALDVVLFEALLTNMGTNKAGDAITNIPLFTTGLNAATEALNPSGLWYFNQVMKDIGNDQQFGVIGGQIVSKIAAFKNWATMNNAGVDLSKADDSIPYLFYDRNADSLIGNTDLLELTPGAVQIVTWNKYAGSMKKTVTDLYTHGQITLPTTGLTLDYEWTYDYNCKVWTFEAFLYIELAAVPAGGCGVPGANGMIRIHDCSALSGIPVCPEIPVG